MKVSKFYFLMGSLLFSFMMFFAAGSGINRLKSKVLINGQNGSISDILKQWRLDSLGCKNIRNMSNIQLLIDSLKIDYQIPSKVESLLGRPNNVVVGKSNYTLIYYINSYCVTRGTVQMTPSNIDRCWIEFNFRDTSKRCLIIEMCQ